MELPDDEMPPEEMWGHHARLSEWFESVKERRKNPDQYPVEHFDTPTTANQDPEAQKILEEVRGGH